MKRQVIVGTDEGKMLRRKYKNVLLRESTYVSTVHFFLLLCFYNTF